MRIEDRLTEDGKTMEQEARDSSQMIGVVLIIAIVEIAVAVGFFRWIMS